MQVLLQQAEQGTATGLRRQDGLLQRPSAVALARSAVGHDTSGGCLHAAPQETAFFRSRANITQIPRGSVQRNISTSQFPADVRRRGANRRQQRRDQNNENRAETDEFTQHQQRSLVSEMRIDLHRDIFVHRGALGFTLGWHDCSQTNGWRWWWW